ncbi:hypothetical protein Tco_0113970 [Tanacetum coccineum]
MSRTFELMMSAVSFLGHTIAFCWRVVAEGSSSAGSLIFPSPTSSNQDAKEFTRLRSSKLMSGLASLMLCFNMKTLKDGHNADSEMQDDITSIFDAPFLTRSVCRKSPHKRTNFPPNKEDGLSMISLKLLSNASKQRRSFIGASSQIIRLVSANNFPS